MQLRLSLVFCYYISLFIICLIQSTWFGLLHHVCDVHDWSGGACDQRELEDHWLPWFDRQDKDFKALEKIALDPLILDNLFIIYAKIYKIIRMIFNKV